MNRQTPRDLDEAVREFQAAVAADPHYGGAYAGLADAYCWVVSFGRGQADTNFPLARDAAVKALAEDASLASPHKVLGWVKHSLEWDTAGAAREFGLALELNDKDAMTHAWYSIYLSHLARAAEAIDEAKHAEDLEPLSPHIGAMVAIVLVRLGHHAEGLAEIERTLQLQPEYPLALVALVELGEQTRDFRGAVTAGERLALIRGGNAETARARTKRVTEGLQRKGPSGYWEDVLQEATTSGDTMYAAIAAAQLGQIDLAFAKVGHACQARDWLIRVVLRADARLSPLRSDARYPALLRCAGYE